MFRVLRIRRRSESHGGRLRSLAVASGVIAAVVLTPVEAQPWHFTDVTASAGLAFDTGYTSGLSTPPRVMAGGVAAGDYDGDGWPDLYVIRGDIGPNLLLRNRGDGTFEEVGAAAGLTLSSGSGPTFVDFDGDGRLDLFVGGIDGAASRLFRNVGGGRFAEAGGPLPTHPADVYSSAWGDFDRDGDLDLATTHWASFPTMRLWRRNGDGSLTEVTVAAGLSGGPAQIYSFTPNFTDINGDGWPDLLLAADFGTSQVYVNDRDGTFTRTTTNVISDENGMGSAVGDYDRDGDLDWFVSSIWDPNGISELDSWGISGNRLYRNRGDGTFEDATEDAGVRRGYWGWGSTFSDFDNDGHLDIFHVNGFPGLGANEYHADPARLFVSNGNGTFTQRAEELGVADTGQGRGVVSFDYDRDGDLDLFITNAGQQPRLYRNDGGNAGRWFRVVLRGTAPNTGAIGAKISLTSGGATQLRELRAGSNFVSQDPAEAHFGLGTATTVQEVRIVWPDGTVSVRTNASAGQALTVVQGGGPAAVDVPTLGVTATIVFALLLAGTATRFLTR